MPLILTYILFFVQLKWYLSLVLKFTGLSPRFYAFLIDFDGENQGETSPLIRHVF